MFKLFTLICLILFSLSSIVNPAFSQNLIDLNSASKEELEKLPGIGPATAQKIIELREKKGGFRKVEELLEVSGIGPKKLEAIKPYVKVEGLNPLGGVNQNQPVSHSASNPTRTPIYKYVDEHGVVHFTQFPEAVPPKYRKSLREVK